MEVEFRNAGDSALILYLRGVTASEGALYLRSLLEHLDQQPPLGVTDAVPALSSLLLTYDPLQTTPEELRVHLSRLALRADGETSQPALVEIPVLYGGEAGVDLGAVAAAAALSEQAAIELHCSQEYTVFFLGFTPGFAYMGPLPEPLQTPRLGTPRVTVPAGSVAIAEDQTGIYPVASPGGWRLIGRTPLRLFDPRKDPPTLLRPGDRVRFVAVDAATYSRLHSETLAGRS